MGPFMQKTRAVLLARRLNELSTSLSELEDLRAQIEEAERRAHGRPRLRANAAVVATRVDI